MKQYDFYCQDCNTEFSVYLKEFYDSGKHTISCPSCGSTHILKLIMRSSAIFKGKGFYSTDNRKKEYDE